MLLGIGLVALVAVLLYASYVENARNKRIDSELAELRGLRTMQSKCLTHIDQLLDRIIRCEGSVVELGTRSQTTIKHHGQEIEILQVRQRTLEKKIVSSERTVNLVFGKPIPVQMENIPHAAVINKQKPTTRGRGKAALIPENA